MSKPIELSISVKVGPATITFEANEGDELLWIDEASFIQKVLDLRKYVGDPEDPGEDPRAAPLPTPSEWVGPVNNVVTYPTSSPSTPPTPTSVAADASLLDNEDRTFTEPPRRSGGSGSEVRDNAGDHSGADDFEEAEMMTGGQRVGRVAGTSFAT